MPIISPESVESIARLITQSDLPLIREFYLTTCFRLRGDCFVNKIGVHYSLSHIIEQLVEQIPGKSLVLRK